MPVPVFHAKPFWRFLGTAEEQPFFGTPETCLTLKGTQVSADVMSRVTRVEAGGQTYYIKCYHQHGKRLRRFLGRSRAKGEWQNLEYFARMNIPTPRLVAYGRHHTNGASLELLITAEVENSQDLASLALKQPERFAGRAWSLAVMRQIADHTRRLHHDNFIHWDLKWRNILIQDHAEPKVYFFDSPLGKHWRAGLQHRGKIKDLGCLDLGARKVLTRSQRLRFYLLYRQMERLTPAAKKQIGKINAFLVSKARRRARRHPNRPT